MATAELQPVATSAANTSPAMARARMGLADIDRHLPAAEAGLATGMRHERGDRTVGRRAVDPSHTEESATSPFG